MYFFTDEAEKLFEDAEFERSIRMVCASLDATTNGIVLVNPDGSPFGCNDQFLELIGVRPAEDEEIDPAQLKRNLWSLVDKPDELRDQFRDLNSNPTARNKSLFDYAQNRKLAQRTRPITYDGEYLGRVWSFRDVSQRHRAEQQVEYFAYNDPLTGLPNRRAFEQHCREHFTSDEPQTKKALLYLDLDRFGRVNITLGNEVGDLVLRNVARRWEEATDPNWFLSRVGSDEFGLLVEDVDDRQEAEQIAGELLGKLSNPIEVWGNELPVRATAGIVLFPQHGNSTEDLINHARLAMKQSRQGEVRGNTYQFFLPEMDEEDVHTIHLESKLDAAIQENRLSLAYQPQYDLRSGDVLGLEALCRWETEDYGSVSPGTFIPLAEKTGLIHDLGRWVLRTATHQLHRWRNEQNREIRVSVNLSARQLVEEDQLIQTVQSTLGDLNLDPSSLELEVTESVALQEIGVANDVLKQLQQLGVRLSLDDFGTGQASLSYLSRLNFDSIKIDRQFIKHITESNRQQELLRSILALADKLDMEVISEGIENPRHLDRLLELNCPYGQGFYLGRPQSVENLGPFLNGEQKPDHLTA